MRAYRLPVRCSGRNFVSVSEREILNPTSALWGSSKPFPSGFDGELSGDSETEGLTAGSYVFCVLALRREKARRDGGSRRAAACRKTFSTRWETAKKVRKTSNSRLSAYIDTLRRELRSKSKLL